MNGVVNKDNLPIGINKERKCNTVQMLEKNNNKDN